jgi:hypothetical protein
VLHIHPPNDLTQGVFTYIAGMFQSQQAYGQNALLIAAKCVYFTAKSTTIHHATLVQSKQVGVMQLILEGAHFDEKIKLVAL